MRRSSRLTRQFSCAIQKDSCSAPCDVSWTVSGAGSDSGSTWCCSSTASQPCCGTVSCGVNVSEEAPTSSPSDDISSGGSKDGNSSSLGKSSNDFSPKYSKNCFVVP